MKLSHLASHEGMTLHGPDHDITGITADSRQVKPGYLFIAIPGTQHDGTAFIAEAVKRGAVAVLMPEGVPLPSLREGLGEGMVKGNPETPSPNPSRENGRGASPAPSDITFLTTANIRLATSTIAAAYYPRQPETIVAVTGTSGKTSTAQFTREIWQAMGETSASIGTLGLITATEARYGKLTTPDAITLHQLLEECADKGISHLAMEASSHGLDLHRLDHVRIKAGGFTNLSRDHLDYHATMEAYLAAKQRLFTHVMSAGGAAVLNADIPEFRNLSDAARGHALHVLSYGKKGKDIRLMNLQPRAQGQALRIEVLGKQHDLRLPLIGAFQAWNSLCALGLVIGSGGDPDKAVAGLNHVTGVPGRLQLVGTSAKGGAVFVDYAHKPDALDNVLQALRPHVAAHQGAKLGVVFGCGGNRDKGKRPLMGEIATRLADWVIVTDDNPRHEEPAVVRQEILAGCKPGATLQEIGDRAAAIEAGIRQLGQGDVLIIAGKGHEPGQIVGDVTHPFDDAEVARGFLVHPASLSVIASKLQNEAAKNGINDAMHNTLMTSLKTD